MGKAGSGNISVDEFMELFIMELEINYDLRSYHRLINSKSSFLFRKAYLEQRIRYVKNQLPCDTCIIWDVGCGYATSAIFLSLLGHKVVGTTLEFYYDKIQKRLDYWSRFGNVDALSVRYENLFDIDPEPEKYDVVLVQDTLHHLEPINEAIKILGISLKSRGKIISSEENGNNLICNLKHFRERGFKRVIKIYDEKLNKYLLFGNENTRNLKTWEKLFNQGGFCLQKENTEYIRFYPPFSFSEKKYESVLSKEQRIWRKNSFLRERFFFGINFTLQKCD